jgi:hypothetical protein
MIHLSRSNRYSRRALLKGLGIGLGTLPLLNSERVRAQSGGVAKRMIAITWGGGVVPAQFYMPPGPITTLSPILAPLEAWKTHILAIRGKGTRSSDMGGIDAKALIDTQGMNYGGHFSYRTLLTGSGTGGKPSIDTLMAENLATAGFPKAQLNVGLRPGNSSTSWRTGGVKNTAELDPYRLFSTLFAGANITPAQIDTLRLRRKSVLDHVIGELGTFQTRIGSDDNKKVQAHLDSIRNIEGQLVAGATAAPGAGCAPPPNTPAGLNFKTVTNFPTHFQLMLDLVAAAVKCDMSRAITIDIADNGGANTLSFPWLNIPSPDFHAIAHQGSNGYTAKIQIDTWFITQVARLVQQLGTNPEGAATTLDNTAILVLNDMNEGSFHDVRSLPFFIIGSAGGFFKTGQCVQLPANVPNNLFLTSVLHAMGMPQVTSVGDTYPGDIDAVLKA